jgi:transcriptional regulator with XRE-family HTH domain
MGRSRARAEHGAIVETLRKARMDAGLTQRTLSRAAGLGPTAVWELEDGRHEPTLSTLACIAAALGGELAVRYYAGSGPIIRDHLQAAMIEALLGRLHPRWSATPEVWVTQPIRGVIDLLLRDRDSPVLVASEAHSQIRAIEQQVRWLGAKVTSLGATASGLLLVRSTAATRAVAAEYAAYLATAFPARHEDAVAALVQGSAWPGASMVWMEVSKGRASILARAPGR